MEKIIVDAFKLKRISSLMSKEFGTVPKNQEGEEPYSLILLPMESNLLKLHRQNPLRNGQHAIAAIQMSLLTIDGYFREIEYDFNRFANVENQSFLHGLLMTFDPFTNPKIHKLVMEDNDGFDAKKYFELPIICLIRMEKSVRLWTEDFGKNGYFEFIERQIGRIIKSDDKTDFCAQIFKKTAKKFKWL